MHHCEWFRQKGSGCACKALEDVTGNATAFSEHGKHCKNKPASCPDGIGNVDCRGITHNITDEFTMLHLA